MAYRDLEFTLISAEDLKNVNNVSKMDVYGVGTLAGNSRSRQRTPTHKNAGKNPNWNFPMKFFVDEAAAHQNRLSLHFQIYSQRSLGDRRIGEVSVQIKELLDTAGDGQSAQFGSYEVRTSSGEHQGFLKFSFKFGEKITASAPAPAENLSNPASDASASYPYPASSSSAPYPPPAGMHPYHPPGGYPPPPVAAYGYGAPPSGCGASQLGYGAPPPGYGYQPQQAGYGYGYSGPVEGRPKKKKFLNILGGTLATSASGGVTSYFLKGFNDGDDGDDAGFD